MPRFYNVDPALVRHAREVMDLNASQALAVCNLFGFLHGLQKHNAVYFSQANYARLMGNDRKHVGLLLKRLQAAGWIEYSSDMRGTKVACIQFDYKTEGLLLVDGDESAAPTGVSSTDAGGESPEPMGVSPQTPGGESVDPTFTNSSTNTTTNKKDAITNHSEEIIDLWNQEKPKKWPKLSRLSPSRIAMLRKLTDGSGGVSQLLIDLPVVMRAVRKDSWWSSKEMTFENFIGGKTLKGEFSKFLDIGLAMPCQASNNDTTPRTLEHPDFFPPLPSGSIRPKHNSFIDKADRKRREEEAREFYQSQEVSQ